MKSCPICDTIYEDHVSQCLADGADLIILTDVESLRLTPGSTAAPPQRVVAAPVAVDTRSRSWGPILLLLFGLASILFLLGAIAIWVSLQPADLPVPQTRVEPVVQSIQVEEAVEFTSEPSGAEVHEHGKRLCTTPCTVMHSEAVGLPRSFVLKHPEVLDTPHIMEEPELPQHVVLHPKQAPAAPVVPAPQPPPRPVRRPSPTPPPPPPPAPIEPKHPKPNLSSDR